MFAKKKEPKELKDIITSVAKCSEMNPMESFV